MWCHHGAAYMLAGVWQPGGNTATNRYLKYDGITVVFMAFEHQSIMLAYRIIAAVYMSVYLCVSPEIWHYHSYVNNQPQPWCSPPAAVPAVLHPQWWRSTGPAVQHIWLGCGSWSGHRPSSTSVHGLWRQHQQPRCNLAGGLPPSNRTRSGGGTTGTGRMGSNLLEAAGAHQARIILGGLFSHAGRRLYSLYSLYSLKGLPP